MTVSYALDFYMTLTFNLVTLTFTYDLDLVLIVKLTLLTSTCRLNWSRELYNFYAALYHAVTRDRRISTKGRRDAKQEVQLPLRDRASTLSVEIW